MQKSFISLWELKIQIKKRLEENFQFVFPSRITILYPDLKLTASNQYVKSVYC